MVDRGGVEPPGAASKGPDPRTCSAQSPERGAGYNAPASDPPTRGLSQERGPVHGAIERDHGRKAGPDPRVYWRGTWHAPLSLNLNPGPVRSSACADARPRERAAYMPVRPCATSAPVGPLQAVGQRHQRRRRLRPVQRAARAGHRPRADTQRRSARVEWLWHRRYPRVSADNPAYAIAAGASTQASAAPASTPSAAAEPRASAQIRW